VIVRIWRTGIDPARADEYERFADERSLPMFRSQTGFRGVLFTKADDGERAVVTFWDDAAALEELARSETYRVTVDALVATGLLRGEQFVEVLQVHGRDLPSG
jgi:heme-degrading monooxygenase HmoA